MSLTPQPDAAGGTKPAPITARIFDSAMALCLAVMAGAVFVNVVLRYGFGSGVAASEELSRLLFVWMVFIGATAAYPRGEHMAFTSLLNPLRGKPALAWVVRGIHLMVVLASLLIAWGAWQQVLVGMGSHSVVLGYSTALLPLPALLCTAAIAVMAAINLVRGKSIDFGHESDVE